MSGNDVVLTPWHYIIVPTDSPAVRRLRGSNPAVLATIERHSDSWEAAFRALVEQGATDDEIWRGDWCALLPIALRRHLPALLHDVRKAWLIDNVTTDLVVAEKGRRIASGERYGYDALADHFHVSVGTIRDRLNPKSGKQSTRAPRMHST